MKKKCKIKRKISIQKIFCIISILFIIGCFIFYGKRLIKYYKIYNPKYYESNKEYLKEKQRKYYQSNKEHYYEYEKERSKRPERIEYTNKHNIKYRQENLEKIRKWDKQRHEQNKLNRNFSTAIYITLKDAKANRHWEDLVPYNLQQLKEHLEKQFDESMNWNNYGEYWEIDRPHYTSEPI